MLISFMLLLLPLLLSEHSIGLAHLQLVSFNHYHLAISNSIISICSLVTVFTDRRTHGCSKIGKCFAATNRFEWHQCVACITRPYSFQIRTYPWSSCFHSVFSLSLLRFLFASCISHCFNAIVCG